MKTYYITTTKIVEETYQIEANDFEEAESKYETGKLIDYKEYDESITLTQHVTKEDKK